MKKNLVAFVTRGFERFEINLVAFVATTFQLCLKIFQLVATVTSDFEEIQKVLVAVVTMMI